MIYKYENIGRGIPELLNCYRGGQDPCIVFPSKVALYATSIYLGKQEVWEKSTERPKDELS